MVWHGRCSTPISVSPTLSVSPALTAHVTPGIRSLAWPYTRSLPLFCFCNAKFPPAWSWCLCVVKTATILRLRRFAALAIVYGSAGSIAAVSLVAWSTRRYM